MKLLHTSDWHLGMELHGHQRLQEQKKFLDWLSDLCLQQEVDALLISGDIFDVANPSANAQHLWSDFLIHLHSQNPNLHIIATAGNHDSALRFEVTRPFTEALGHIHLIGSLNARTLNSSDLFHKAIIPLQDSHGSLQGIVAAVPFMRSSDLICKPLQNENISDAYTRTLGEFYQQLRKHAQTISSQVPLIAMGHFTLHNSHLSGSEHMLIGGLEDIEATAIKEGFDYLALGHIHRAQKIQHDWIRYCGSPLNIQFDERHYHHQVLLVEIEKHQSPAIQPITVPSFVPFLQIPPQGGTWDDLLDFFEQMDWDSFQCLPKDLHPFVRIQLQWNSSLNDLKARIEELCQNKPLRLIGSPQLQNAADETISTSNDLSIQNHRDLNHPQTPEFLLKQHWHIKYGETCPESVLKAFQEILSQVHTQGEEL